MIALKHRGLDSLAQDASQSCVPKWFWGVSVLMFGILSVE